MIFQPNVKLKDSFEFLEPSTQGYIHCTHQLAQTESKTTKFSLCNKTDLQSNDLRAL